MEPDTDPQQITGADLRDLGLPHGPIFGLALAATKAAADATGRDGAITRVRGVVGDPETALGDPWFGALAAALIEAAAAAEAAAGASFVERAEPAPYVSWCAAADANAVEQMDNSMRLPSAVRGALMPDAHMGYGLPIGGVLATEGTVVPYAVGVDIACRMKLTVLDIDPRDLAAQRERFEKTLLRETAFGTGSVLRNKERLDHDVLDAGRWTTQQLLRNLRDKAAAQLGTSGSGNHFVEFGVLTLEQPDLGLDAGTYLALMSHSGSRGPGAMIAGHFTKRARALHPKLPPELSHLAWLDLDSEDGQAYWEAMNLMGDFASACHWVIHERVRRALKAKVIAGVENHHNFAWLEQHDGRELVVHRKGATPAGEGVLGVIPGSMASPAFVVRGKGSEASLQSASHGAGRVMSRTAAKQRFTWKDVRPILEAANVTLLSAGIDENPGVYKDIHEVMAQQADLVEVVARFDPRIVRMADGRERPED
jgi:tRNA-splicing ligase RtcB (3'-phosphate/5'-hydroxy nucleic acid ligase)